MSDKFYLSTAIAYVNGAPHIGHALEFIQADAVARYHRQRGSDVHFLTGTDEHGTKIAQTAEAAGVTPQELCDENAAKFKNLRDTFDLSWDDFIRTTDRERHFPAVTKLWEELVANGDLYEKEYEGLYCSGCEEFKREKDLVDGLCPAHNREPEIVKEKNWFFRLSKYSEQILQKLESQEIAIVPEFRAKEIINVVRDGLTDVSFSRPRTSLEWGIPVPGDDSQVMYVWCDALTNYISALGYGTDDALFQKYWPADMHCIGKDIVRFHAGIWIGMLMSVGLPLPKSIFVHGFVTSEGQKMGKSLGNVVDPVEVVADWGTDPLRYYLLSEIPCGQDGDFSQARFGEKYTAELANGLGNLVSRVIAMAVKHGEEFEISNPLDPEVTAAVEKMWTDLDAAMPPNYDFRSALSAIFALVEWANKRVTEKEPWTLKDQPELQKQILGELLVVICQLAVSLAPFVPETTKKIASALGVTLDGDFAELKNLEDFKKFQLTKPEILFPRREEK